MSSTSGRKKGSKKVTMTDMEDDLNGEVDPSNAADWAFVMSRRERKRKREQRRRSELSESFHSLASVLLKVDPDLKEEAFIRERRRNGGVLMSGTDEQVICENTSRECAPLFSRVELVNRATWCLEQLHGKFQKQMKTMEDSSEEEGIETKPSNLKKSRKLRDEDDESEEGVSEMKRKKVRTAAL